jgi:hypothetical protein
MGDASFSSPIYEERELRAFDGPGCFYGDRETINLFQQAYLSRNLAVLAFADGRDSVVEASCSTDVHMPPCQATLERLQVVVLGRTKCEEWFRSSESRIHEYAQQQPRRIVARHHPRV